jgi:hypothetical protein
MKLRWPMRTTSSFLVAVAGSVSMVLLNSPAAAAGEFAFSSYHDGRRYLFIISSERQARCPKWDPEKAANPPVSAAKALASAKTFIATIETNKRLFWDFEDLSLVNVDGWAWRARFRLRPKREGSTGQWPTMDCWILMDGSVVQPSVSPFKE